jgi:NADH-quinone oxidoreductase subunit L
MKELLFLIPALPFSGFLILALMGSRLSKRMVAVVGAGSVGLAALLTIFTACGFFTAPPEGNAFSQTLWTWMQFEGYSVSIAITLDPLSLIMILVITVVGFLIHLYSTEFMQNDAGYGRFFAYMNLFVGSMLTLVLADNLVLLYLDGKALDSAATS